MTAKGQRQNQERPDETGVDDTLSWIDFPRYPRRKNTGNFACLQGGPELGNIGNHHCFACIDVVE